MMWLIHLLIALLVVVCLATVASLIFMFQYATHRVKTIYCRVTQDACYRPVHDGLREGILLIVFGYLLCVMDEWYLFHICVVWRIFLCRGVFKLIDAYEQYNATTRVITRQNRGLRVVLRPPRKLDMAGG